MTWRYYLELQAEWRFSWPRPTHTSAKPYTVLNHGYYGTTGLWGFQASWLLVFKVDDYLKLILSTIQTFNERLQTLLMLIYCSVTYGLAHVKYFKYACVHFPPPLMSIVVDLWSVKGHVILFNTHQFIPYKQNYWRKLIGDLYVIAKSPN